MSKAKMVGWMLYGLSCGCGGQAERAIDDRPGEGQAQADGSGSATGNTVPLGACMPGFDRYENLDRPCNWLADALCYDTKDQACACICPRDKESLCLSGLPAPGSATRVTCD
jgi:hypothetical protein